MVIAKDALKSVWVLLSSYASQLMFLDSPKRIRWLAPVTQNDVEQQNRFYLYYESIGTIVTNIHNATTPNTVARV